MEEENLGGKPSDNTPLSYVQQNSVQQLFQDLNSQEIESFLLEGAKITPKIWEINKKNGVQLSLNQNTDMGHSDMDGHIELGLKKGTEDIKEMFGLNKDSSDVELKRYIFSHENNHYVLWYMFKHQDKFPYFAKIYNKLKQIRQFSGGQGLSQLGNLSMYEQRRSQHDEDFVELLNKYCLSPDDFMVYLNSLVSGVDRWKKNLWKISEKDANWFFEGIANCVEVFLEENGMKL